MADLGLLVLIAVVAKVALSFLDGKGIGGEL
jgi:hypothetical protein